MSTPDSNPPGPPTGGGEDRVLALLLLLPAAILAWPGAAAPLADDPFPHVAGSGWLALGCAPLAAWLAWRRSARMALGSLPLAIFVLWGFVALGAGAATDTFEARRALVHGCAALLLLAGGAGLGAAGRTWLVGGMLLLSPLWTIRALMEGDGHAGVLGNSGALGQAALPGAIAGAWLLAVGRGQVRVLGAAVFLLFAIHTGMAPVLAGIVSAGAVFVASAVLSPALKERGWVRPALVLLTLVPVVVWFGWRAVPEDDRSHWSVSDFAEGDTSGFGVRLMLWEGAPGLLGDHLLLGTGPGQVHADFPPHRDPEEIHLSNYRSCEDHPAEIDHLHNDWIQGVVEGGIVGGLAWLAFLATGLLAAVRALRSTETSRAILGAAALGLLVNAGAHSPFLFHPASAALGFALLGAVGTREGTAGPSKLGWLLLVPAVFAAWVGKDLVAHGHALTRAFQAAERVAAAAEAGTAPLPADVTEAAEAFEAAQAAAPDAVPVLHLAARELVAPDPAAAEAAYHDILALRPHDPTSWIQLGTLQVRAGRLDEARQSWLRVLAVDPEHPRVLRNLTQLEVDAADDAAAAGYLDTLAAAGCLQEDWLDGFVLYLLYAGRGPDAFPLLARTDTRFLDPSGGLVHGIHEELESTGQLDLASGLESAAHHLWALEHVTTEDWSTAIRSYRRALAPTLGRWDGGAPILRCEKAACELYAGRVEDAQATLLGLPRDPLTWNLLPDWAKSPLEERGLYGPTP